VRGLQEIVYQVEYTKPEDEAHPRPILFRLHVPLAKLAKLHFALNTNREIK